jgi:Fe-S cluster assembly protein SufD
VPSSVVDAAEGARVSIAEFFQEVLAGSTDTEPVSTEERSEAFKHFEQTDVPGSKPGRDWKFDYARVKAIDVPFRGSHPSTTGPIERALPPDAFAAQAHLSYPFAQIRPVEPNASERGLRLHYSLMGRGREMFRASLGRAVNWKDDPFTSLSVAFAHNGIIVHVPAGLRLEKPVLIQHDAMSTGVDFPYILVVLEEGSEVTVVEDATGSGFTSGIVEAIVGERARLHYIAVQRTEADGITLMNRGAVCAENAECRWSIAELGGALSRSIVTTKLVERGASGELAALFFNDGDQHVDLSTLVEHVSGDTTSHTVVKSAARDRGQGRYLGNIRIGRDANGSDATLHDAALLLSRHAHIDSVPALEIASNDVKAYHGATVGSIDEDELFYAESRGIARADAQRMIALGFFEPVVHRFGIDSVRDTLRASLEAKATPGEPSL